MQTSGTLYGRQIVSIKTSMSEDFDQKNSLLKVLYTEHIFQTHMQRPFFCSLFFCTASVWTARAIVQDRRSARDLNMWRVANSDSEFETARGAARRRLGRTRIPLYVADWTRLDHHRNRAYMRCVALPESSNHFFHSFFFFLFIFPNLPCTCVASVCLMLA